MGGNEWQPGTIRHRDGSFTATAEFIIKGSGTLPVMLRGMAVHSGVDPEITLLKHNGSQWDTVFVNDEWERDPNASAVLQLPQSLQLPDRYGNDAGVLTELAAGVYTLQLSSNSADGQAVVGVDAVGESGATLVNISTRARVSGGSNDAFAGFVISGTGSLPLMLRGIAAEAGVDPRIKLLKHNGSSWDTVAENDEWENDSEASRVSALPVNLQLPDTYGNDAGLWRELGPGTYSLQLSSGGNAGRAVVGVDVVE